jgi:hypothetical protein
LRYVDASSAIRASRTSLDEGGPHAKPMSDLAGCQHEWSYSSNMMTITPSSVAGRGIGTPMPATAAAG